MPDSRPTDNTVADAVRGHWADRFLPESWKPYARTARLERPIGWWLLLWPCWWSAAMASDAAGYAFPNLWYLLLFLIGAVVMRGAGCTYNDIVDRKIDAEVARTRSRPIPSGQVSVTGAVVFMVVLALIGLAVLLQFDPFTILLGIASLGTIVIYPFLKRFTNWPQIGLGISFSWGALMGWSALFGDVDLPAIVLYLGCIFWVIGYDTIYALQDKEDDTLAGVRSTARLFGRGAKRLIAVSYVAATLLFAVSFWLADTDIIAFVGLALGTAHLAWQVNTLDTENPDRCLRLFRSNRDYGWILFLGILVDGMVFGRMYF
jgi:4-hydroxybenzoate polyprenyltransferase